MSDDGHKAKVPQQKPTPFVQTDEARLTSSEALDADEARLQQRIRDKAYELWVLEGKPNWQQERHWDMAKELVAQEDNAGAALKPVDSGINVVEEAEIALGNHGDMPGLTDQADPPKIRRSTARR